MSNPEMSRMLAEANQSQQDFIHRWNRGERGPTSNFNYGPSRPYIPDASTSPVYFDGHQIVVVQRTPSPSARVPLSEVVEELIQKHWRENNMPGARHAAQPSPSPWPSSPPITERPVDNSLSPCLSSYKMPEADELFKPARTQVAYARRDPPTGLHSPGTWPTSDPALASSSTPYGIPPPKPPPDTLPMSSSTPVPSLGYNTWPTSDPAAALSSTPYGIQPGYYGPLITSNSLPPPKPSADTPPMSSSTPVPSLGYNTWPTSDPAAALSSTPYGIQPGYYGPLITSNSLPPPKPSADTPPMSSSTPVPSLGYTPPPASELAAAITPDYSLNRSLASCTTDENIQATREADSEVYGEITFQNSGPKAIRYSYVEANKQINGVLEPCQTTETRLVLHRVYTLLLRRGREKEIIFRTWTQQEEWDLADCFEDVEESPPIALSNKVEDQKFYVTIPIKNTSDHYIMYHYLEDGQVRRDNVGPNHLVEVTFELHKAYNVTLRCGVREEFVTRTWTQRVDWDLARYF